MKISNFKRIWIAASALLLLASCTKEVEVGGGGTTITNEGSVSVMLSLDIPGTRASSRALTSVQEDAVKTVDVFVFDRDDKLVDWKYGTMNSSGDGFTALIESSKSNTDTYRLMVLANARHITYPRFKGTPNSVDKPGGDDLGGYKDKSYAEVYAYLTCDIEQTLLVSTTDAYADKGIPMWGMMKDATVVNESNNSFSMDMLRSVAMIDVGTNPIPQTNSDGSSIWAPLSNFSLEKVHLYNSNKEYSVIPAAGKYDYAGKKVTGLSLPVGVGKHTAPIEYSDDKQAGTVTRDGDDKGYAVASAIYAAETDVKMGGTYGDNKHPDRTALVVAGYYSPDPATPNTTDLSYYRIDFAPGGTLTDLLRNHTYQITISSVSGSGSPSPEEAMKKIDADLTVVVNRWSNAGLESTTVDGDYFLTVDPHNLEYDKWPKDEEQVTIKTNAPLSGGKSWTASIEKANESDPALDWIAIKPGTESGVTGGRVLINVTEVPSGSDGSFSRSAKLRIKAGTMTHDIIVTQRGEDSEFMLRPSHSEMVFAGRKWNSQTDSWEDPDPQILSINWGPTVHPYDLKLTDYTGSGVDMAVAIPASSSTATQSIAPEAIPDSDPRVIADPFFERSSRLGITAHDQMQAETITKQVLIRQVYYSLIVTGTTDYYFQGRTYSFNLKSNTSWRAEITGDDIFASGPSPMTGGNNTAAGQNFTFTIKGNAPVDAMATITFYNSDDLFPPQTYKIVVQDIQPNSYIVAPGGNVVIPVSKAYRVWEYDHDLGEDLTAISGTRSARLLWQDEQSLITSVNFTPSGDESQSFITMSTGSGKTGNAVVAFTIGGEIYWSWHIWVTDYDPDTAGPTKTVNGCTFMDRNLGAMGNSGYPAYGLYYEGGRKDPFPTAKTATTASDRKTIYNLNNEELNYNQAGGVGTAAAPASGGIHLSIKNPMVFYQGTYGNINWYGVFAEPRNDIWSVGDQKSDFDPCPRGWKVMTEKSLAGIASMPAGSVNPTWEGMYFPSQGYIAFSLTEGLINYNNRRLSMWYNRETLYPCLRAINEAANTTSLRQSTGAPTRCIRE